MQAAESGPELLVTIVVAAADDRQARAACAGFLDRVGGRIVGSCDCSDEEPGCWSVTISSSSSADAEPHPSDGAVENRHDPAALARQVRTFLRELGSGFAGAHVSCEPPTAWTVVDDPELLGELVPGGDRMLVEAWLDGSLAPAAPTGSPESRSGPASSDVDTSEVTALRLAVDVVTDRAAGAEWPARALAGRLARHVAVTSRSEHPPVVRVAMDLGRAEGAPADVVADAVGRLGGEGWTGPRATEGETTAQWTAASTPDAGICAIRVAATPAQHG